MNWWILRRQPHVSWLIASMYVALLTGVFLAQYSNPAVFASSVWCLIGISLIVVGLLRRYLYLVPLILIGGLLVGLWRGSVQNVDLQDIQGLYGQNISISGAVREDVDTNQSGQLVIRLGSLFVNERPVQGTVWVTSSTDVDVKRSDTLTIKGKLGQGFGSFCSNTVSGSNLVGYSTATW